MTFKQQTISALSWSACERFSQQGLQFIITIILARLLSPVEFGLIGMLTIFIAIGQSLIESGFGQALIQKQDVTYTDECSIFYFNILAGLLTALLLFFIAPLIADFYNQSLLIPLAQVLSLNLIFNSFCLIQTTLLSKQLDFKTQFKVGLGATIPSGVLGIGMAYLGCGVWSLVSQSLSRTLLNALLLWSLNPWRPKWIISFKSLKQMFGFGSRLLFSGILDTIFTNIYLVVIGKLFSPASLGYYSQAKQIQHLPVVNICSIVARVTFPVFSKIQQEKTLLKNTFRQALNTLIVVIFPMMVGMGVLAEPIISTLLGEKWLPSVPFLKLLCVIGVLWPLHVINLNVLKALGRSDLFFRLELLKKSMTIVSIVITCRWGIEAMLWGQIVTSFAAYYLNSYYSGKLLNYTTFEQVKDLLPYAIVSIVMGSIVYSTIYLNLENMTLFVQIPLGIIVYYSICKFTKLKYFTELEKIIKEKTHFISGQV